MTIKHAPCHPDRPYYAMGKCTACYEGARPRHKDPEQMARMKVYQVEYAAKNAARFAEKRRLRRADPKLRAMDDRSKRSATLRAKYGITLEQAIALLQSQGNSCALCLRPIDPDQPRQMHVDHCHESKRVRGILCLDCNTALGKLGDTPAAIARVLAYVSEDKTKLLAQAPPIKP